MATIMPAADSQDSQLDGCLNYPSHDEERHRSPYERLTGARSDARRFYLVTLFDNLEFTLPVFSIIGPDYFGFSYLQGLIVMVAGMLLVGGLLQVPAGAFADRHGRKRAYLLGTVLIIGNFLPFFVCKTFWLLVLTIPFIGLGKALRAGSVEAILSVVCDASDDVNFHDVTSHGMVAFYVGRIIGAPTGGLLYSWHPLATIAAQLIGYGASALVVTRFREVRHQRGEIPLVATINETLKTFSRRRDIWRVLALVLTLYFAGDLIFAAYQPAFVESGLTSTELGFVFMTISLVSATGAFLFRRLSTRVPAGRVLIFVALVEMTTAVGMAFLTDARALVALIMPIGGAMLIPLASTYVAGRTSPEIRATALSFVGLAWNLGTFSALITAGLLLDASSPATVFWVGCGVTAAGLLLAATSRLREVPTAQPSDFDVRRFRCRPT